MCRCIYLCLLLCMGSQYTGNRPVSGFEHSQEEDTALRMHTDPDEVDARTRCQQEGNLHLLRQAWLWHTSVVSRYPNELGTKECYAASPGCERDDMISCQTSVIGYKLEPRTGSCYKFHRAPRTWYQAYVACHQEYGDLAVINSENEAQVLKEMLKNLSNEEAIIGFREKEGEWLTIEGKSLADAGFDSWAPGEPNNRRGDEMCGFMLRTGLLNDDPCDKLAPFICEIEL